MKRWTLLFLVILSFSISVNAAGLSVKTDAIDNLIMIGEEAVFNIDIQNEQSISDKVTFVISDLDWVWEKEFFDISAGNSKDFTLKIKAPKDVIKAGTYSINLKIYSTSNENVYVYEPLLITVLDEGSMLRVEKVDYSINGLDPTKESNSLKVIIKNRYDKPVNDVKIFLEGNFLDEEYTREVNFKSAELRSEEFSVKLNPNSIYGWHDLRILLKSGDKILLDDTKKVRVGEHSNVKEDKEINNGFLVKKTSIERVNEGNTVSDEIYKVRLSSFERLFSDANPKPTSIDRSGNDYYYIWNFKLNPGESYDIIVEVNYRDPIFLLIALLIIVYLISYLTQSGISISKRILTIKSKEGITYTKVLLLIRNKGKREIKGIRVADQLNNVKSVPSDYGTLRPTKISRAGEHVTVIWDIPSLIGKEERILSYRVNIEIKTKIVLPRAMARYRVGNKTKIAKSNSSLVVG